MQLKDYDEREGKRVWLTTEEIETLLGTADNTTQKISLGLGVRSGLRCAEIVAVTPDIVTTPGGVRVRVWEGKGSKYHETPLSLNHHSTIEAFADVRAESEVEPGMVMEWDGWDDWETFREHYLGAYSAEMQRQQLNKVEWL